MLTNEERDELSECAQAFSLGADDWYTRRRCLDLVAKERESCACEASVNCPVHDVAR